jgi:hypothetical protein
MRKLTRQEKMIVEQNTFNYRQVIKTIEKLNIFNGDIHLDIKEALKKMLDL